MQAFKVSTLICNQLQFKTPDALQHSSLIDQFNQAWNVCKGLHVVSAWSQRNNSNGVMEVGSDMDVLLATACMTAR